MLANLVSGHLSLNFYEILYLLVLFATIRRCQDKHRKFTILRSPEMIPFNSICTEFCVLVLEYRLISR